MFLPAFVLFSRKTLILFKKPPAPILSLSSVTTHYVLPTTHCPTCIRNTTPKRSCLARTKAGRRTRRLCCLPETSDSCDHARRPYEARAQKCAMRSSISAGYTFLIKGKRGWRAAGAAAIRIAQGDPRGIAAFARIAELAMRLVGADEKNEYIFEALGDAHTTLMQEKEEAFGMIEIVCVARILYSLGYISNEALNTALFTHTAYTGESLMEAETMKDKLLSSINRAIAETHL